jgi:threonine/homoserine/homoserine lactone efflux protein
MSLLFFLFQVVGISLSGALAPGPVTAAAIAMGPKNRFAGILIAIGHGIIEFPLMVMIVLGMDKILKSTTTQIAIGLAGGTFLIIMAVGMLRGLQSNKNQDFTITKSGPLMAGILLSGTNPYFLVWWATIGLALATTATGFGVWAFVLFALTHWSCDLVWLSVLSWASFKGTSLLGQRSQRIILLICALALLGFGALFITQKLPLLIKIVHNRLFGGH